MAYRVQQLFMILCHEVNQSLLGNHVQDPATIACALRIVYQSIDRFKKLKWNAASLQDLVSSTPQHAPRSHTRYINSS
jgi:hypothetical protein